MTKIEVEEYSDIRVTSWFDPSGRRPGSPVLTMTVQAEEVELYPDEARELVKALKKHIKKAEGK